MTKTNTLLLSFFLTISFSFNQVDGYDVVENKVVIKIGEEYAPKLGSEKPLILEDLIHISQKFSLISCHTYKHFIFAITHELNQKMILLF